MSDGVTETVEAMRSYYGKDGAAAAAFDRALYNFHNGYPLSVERFSDRQMGVYNSVIEIMENLFPGVHDMRCAA